MEISPLPHKAPFVVESQVEPTPEETVMKNDFRNVDTMQDPPAETVPQPALQE